LGLSHSVERNVLKLTFWRTFRS